MTIVVTVSESTASQSSVIVSTNVSSASLADLITVRLAADAALAAIETLSTTIEEDAATAAAAAVAAAASEATAINRADAAGVSAAAAAASETNAGNHETAASGYATDAGNHATAAAASETTAGNYATAAGVSAANAAASETAAGDHETAAAGHETAASGYADAAAASATTAQNYAEAMADAPVYRGPWDASGGTYPSTPNPETWDYYRINAAGTMTGTQGSMVVVAGDFIHWDVTNDLWVKEATAELDATLNAVANLSTSADRLMYFMDMDEAALTDFTALARSLVGCSTQEAVKILLDAGGYGNFIGTPGTQGFGVGICPLLPVGFLPLSGTYDVTSDNYGNYQYSDGSICVWIPAFYLRIGHTSNPTYATYGVNSIDIKPFSYFADVAAANAAGYMLPRAFIDGGLVKLGFMFDKYECSNNNGVASSLKNGNPLMPDAGFAWSFSSLTGAPSDTIGGAWAAAKTRGSNWALASRFMYAALALLSLAHGQASAAATYCAWYDATGVTNFPKGNNTLSGLNDYNDNTVTFTANTQGFGGAKTGSGTPFAKTTHNGQNNGITDLNGNYTEISQGVSIESLTKTITGATKANPVVLTVTGHTFSTNDHVYIAAVVGMTQLNNKFTQITVVDADHISLNGVDGTAYSTYTSGGIASRARHYVAKESVKLTDMGGGNTLSTDHFGSLGRATNFDIYTIGATLNTELSAASELMGNGANQVLSGDTSGNGYLLTSIGSPIPSGGSAAGSNLFGLDRYRHAELYNNALRNDCCYASSYTYGWTTYSGIWAVDVLMYSSTDKEASFRCGYYWG